MLHLKIQVLESKSPTPVKQTQGGNVGVETLTHSFSTGMKELTELSPTIVSPASKRGKFSCSASEHSPTRCKKQLSFASGSVDIHDSILDAKYDDDQSKTPLRYIEKTEVDIAAEEESLSVLLAKRDSITKRLEKVKNYPSHGNLCRKCHLRLGHTAHSCTYGICDSVFSCGQEKFHSGELNMKELDNCNRKKEKQVQLLKCELENKKAACRSVKESLSRRIEADLFEENIDEYMYYGQKNWTLLRKHVHAVEQYCKNEYNGKRPAKKDIKFVLRKAPEGSRSVNPSTIRARQRHENTAKHVLERRGVQFPTATPSHASSSCTVTPSSLASAESVNKGASLYRRCIPFSKEEEEAQIQTALIESRFNISVKPSEQSIDTCPNMEKTCPNMEECTNSSGENSVDRDESDSSDNDDQDAANILLSLMK